MENEIWISGDLGWFTRHYVITEYDRKPIEKREAEAKENERLLIEDDIILADQNFPKQPNHWSRKKL